MPTTVQTLPLMPKHRKHFSPVEVFQTTSTDSMQTRTDLPVRS